MPCGRRTWAPGAATRSGWLVGEGLGATTRGLWSLLLHGVSDGMSYRLEEEQQQQHSLCMCMLNPMCCLALPRHGHSARPGHLIMPPSHQCRTGGGRAAAPRVRLRRPRRRPQVATQAAALAGGGEGQPDAGVARLAGVRDVLDASKFRDAHIYRTPNSFILARSCSM